MVTISTTSNLQLIKNHHIGDDQYEIFHYKDRNFGLEHIHLKANYPDKFCLIGFYTPGNDDSGVFHALEHMLLSCQSKSISSPESALSMAKQLNIDFVNGYTTVGATYFIFSSFCDNTFKFYLSFIMHSLLLPEFTERDFQRELFSVKHNDNNLNVVNGVVINEMLAALSKPTRIILEAVKKKLFTNTPYQYNAGGNLKDLFQLNLPSIVRNHQEYFVPSNCTVLTMGQSDGIEYHDSIMQWSNANINGFLVKPNIQFKFNKSIANSETDTIHLIELKYLHRELYTASWALPNINTYYERMEGELFYQLLMGTPNAPIRQAIAKNSGQIRIAMPTGYQASLPIPIILLTFESSNQLSAKYLNELIRENITKTFDSPQLSSNLDITLDRIESKYYDIFNHQQPYGTRILLPVLTEAIFGRDYTLCLQLDQLISQLRENVFSLGYLQTKAQEYLINNPPMLTRTNNSKIETDNPQPIKSNLSNPIPTNKIKTSYRNNTYETWNPDKLQVTIRDKSVRRAAQQNELSLYSEKCGNICHFFEIINLTNLSDGCIEVLQLFSQFLTQLPTTNLGIMETQQKQIQSCSLFFSSPKLVDLKANRGLAVNIQIYGKFLARQANNFFMMYREQLDHVSFSDLKMLGELIESIYSKRVKMLKENGSGFAIAQADSGFSAAANLRNKLSGYESYALLETLLNNIRKRNFNSLIEKLNLLYDTIKESERSRMLVFNEKNKKYVVEQYKRHYGTFTNILKYYKPIKYEFKSHIVRQWWIINSPINSCAISYRIKDFDENIEQLELIANIINDEYIFPILREKNNSYHVGATLNYDNRTLNLFSNRTTNIEIDLIIISNSLDWFINDFDNEKVFERHKKKRLFSNKKIYTIPNDQINDFTESFLDANTNLTSNTPNKLTLELASTKTLTKKIFNEQEFSCVAACNHLPKKIINKFNLTKMVLRTS